jgi:hypothetical protein
MLKRGTTTGAGWIGAAGGGAQRIGADLEAGHGRRRRRWSCLGRGSCRGRGEICTAGGGAERIGTRGGDKAGARVPEAERRRRVLQKPPGVRTAERQTKRGRGQMRGQFSAAEPDKC